MFSVYPKFALDLKSTKLNKVLSFIHHFERSDLMNPGDKPFTITYLIGYALTNSHHSIDYKKEEYIKLEDVLCDNLNLRCRNIYVIRLYHHNKRIKFKE